MYKKVDSSLNFVDREREVTKFWKENKIFEKSVSSREGGEEFSFYDGPPTANGKPHIGHVLTRVMKDIIPRYKTMKGCHVLRKAGWDTHGLPVELEVEKTLGLNGKDQIEKYGIEPFIKKCKESVWKYKTLWEEMSDQVGYWADMEHPYVTYDDNYIESEWWSLKSVFDRGLIYKGYKIVPYCPRCGTALASHEVAQGYKDVEETSCTARFRVKGEKDLYILAWTTTPWTLPSNVALCMNANETYCEIEAGGSRYILAETLVGKYFEEYKVLSRKKGAEYEGTEYEPLFGFYKLKNNEKAWFVTCDDYVTLTDGTGVVHIAPAFGEDDSRVGRRYNLPFVQLVGPDGKFVDGCGELTGLFCKDGDARVMDDLEKRGLLQARMKFTHSYPFCWRCDTPLLYYARSSWFIRMTDLKKELVENNAKVNWIPPGIGSGRMGNFLENVIDWGLSRERYWGTPLPIWICDKCGKQEAIGSRKELREKGGLKKDIELHKPYVDGVTWKCSCGGTMRRTPEVIDCWYDSGSMPFAQYHYPFENKDLFDETFPADFISEAVDQTRGWFYTLEAVSALMFGRAPFENCIVLGHVLDKNGLKQSKHLGNVVDPFEILGKQGADAVRWYFYTISNPWIPSRFYAEAVSEVQRKFLGTLWNTYGFYVLYAEIDKFDPTKYSLSDCKLSLMDRWILSGLNTLVAYVDDCLNEYKITEPARAIQDFVDSLSNWYVRRCRERYWGGGMTEDKKAAYMTLYTVLETLARLCAPFIPFMSENIYRNIVCSVDKTAPESVHLCDFPKADMSRVDKELEKGMQIVLTAANIGRSCRNAANIKNRQPLSRLILCGAEEGSLDGELAEVLEGELNVKAIEYAPDAKAFVAYEVKPQLKTLGPKYGKLIGGIRTYLAEHSDEAAAAVENGGKFVFDVSGTTVELGSEDMLISTTGTGRYVSQSDKGLTAVLDCLMTPELKEEGYMRELVSKIQTMRKDNGFEVTDHITVGLSGSALISAVAEKYAESIKADTLCDAFVSGGDFSKEWDVNGEKVTVSVSKAK